MKSILAVMVFCLSSAVFGANFKCKAKYGNCKIRTGKLVTYPTWAIGLTEQEATERAMERCESGYEETLRKHRCHNDVETCRLLGCESTDEAVDYR